MAIIQPFAAIRPSVNEAKSIAALPYDVVNEEEAREIVKRCPHSFLKIDRPEVQFEKGVDPYDDKVYIRARDTLREMIDEGFFIEDTQPCFYLYQLTWKERSQTGLVACASIDDYLNGTIKNMKKRGK